jgi:hypothetical protein
MMLEGSLCAREDYSCLRKVKSAIIANSIAAAKVIWSNYIKG